MFIVFLVVFIDLLGFGIVLPLLPRYSSSYLGVLPDWLQGATLGILFSIFSIMQFFFSPMWGRISDRIGRRPVLLIGLCGSVVFYGLFGAASNIPSSFRLTDEALAQLRKADMPESVLSKLAHLKDREMPEEEMMREIAAVLGNADREKWEFGILSRTNVPSVASWLALGLLFLSRLGAGVAGASVSTAAAVIADCTPPDKRAKGMALIGAAFGFGFTFGPLIGYLGLTVFDRAHWAPGAMASLLSFGALLLAIRMLPETLVVAGKTPAGNELFGSSRTGEVLQTPTTGSPETPVAGRAPAGRELFSISRTREVLRTPTIGSLVLIYFFVIFGFANFEGTLSVFTASAFNLSNEDNFLVFAYVGLVLIIAQGGVYRRLAGKMSEESLLSVGIALMFIGLAGLATVAWMAGEGKEAANLKVSFYCALAAAVFGFAFVNPSVTALVSKRSDPRRQGEVLGVNQSFAALGRILGPLAGLILFNLGLSHTLPYLAGVATLIVVVMLVPRIHQREVP